MNKKIKAKVEIVVIMDLDPSISANHSILDCERNTKIVENFKETMLRKIQTAGAAISLNMVKFEELNVPDIKDIN